jgi:hypothetical protein
MNEKPFWGAIVLLFSAVVSIASVAHAQLRISFVGYSATNTPRSIGYFDETVNDSIVIDVSGMREPGTNPGWFLAWASSQHGQNGYPLLPNTNAWSACGKSDPNNSYDVIALLEPGDFMIGQRIGRDGGGQRTAFIHGDDWQGHLPWEFTSLRVMLIGETYPNQFDGPYCFKTYSIPIVWKESPVATSQSTWGKIKARFSGKSNKQ